MEKEKSLFEQLSSIDLTDKIKQKLGLNYLSWAYARNEIKNFDPNATYEIMKRTVVTSETITVAEGHTITNSYTNEVPYFTDGNTCWVIVKVTIKNVSYEELYPIMDLKNNSVKAFAVTSADVNKALQRAFVKCCARHGLGLYIYAGEDLPMDQVGIDYDKILSEVLTRKYEKPSIEVWNTHRDNVISLIQKIDTYVNKRDQNKVMQIISKLIGAKQKITALDYTIDEDRTNLLCIDSFLTAAKEAFEANK